MLLFLTQYQNEFFLILTLLFILIYLFIKLRYIKKIEKTNKELIKISSIDYLTKINNRKSIDYFLNENIKLFERYKDDFSIILIDIDKFKNINDTFGHLVGDNILIEFSELIRKSIREIDILGRFGVAEYNSKDNIFTLIKKAYTALYLAKTNGRNKVELIR